MRTKTAGLILLFLLGTVSLHAQNDLARQITHIPNYEPVPGDLYRLVIDFGARIGAGTTDDTSTTSVYEILLQEDYTMQIPLIGEVSARGRLFQEVRRDIIRRISNRVPNEYVDFQLLSPAVFDVLVFGTVTEPGLKTVSSVTRLVDLVSIAGGVASGGSQRRVTVRNSTGSEREYDLLRFVREGDREENPFLRPAHTVFIPRREQSVTLGGAVNVPGEYEVLPGERLGDIIALAGGLTPTADVEQMRINRLDERGSYTLRRITDETWPELDLANGDRITIPSTVTTTERITVEGALFGRPTSGEQQTIPEGPIRTTLAHVPGMTLLGVLEELGGPTPFADPRRSYIERAGTGETIPLYNLEEIWTRRDRSRDITLEPGDYVVIPSSTAEVLVAGDVAQPNRYPWVSGRTVLDYALLAGGLTRQDALERRFYRMDEGGRLEPMEITTRVHPGEAIFIASPEQVAVTGQVNAPGRFAYSSARTVGDYILLAGGINPEESNQRRIFFVDTEGRRTRTSLTEPVEPGQVIFLDRDGWGKFKKFTRDFNLVQTFLTAIGVTLTLNAIYDGAVIPFP